MSFILFHLFLLQASVTDLSHYTSHQKISLTQKEDGVVGVLEILRDVRLTALDIKSLEVHDADFSLSDSKRFKSIPMKSAVIRFTTDRQQEAQVLDLEKPLASIEAVSIENDKRIFFLTQDFGIGMGSYNGPLTEILEITPHGLVWAEAFDQKTSGGTAAGAYYARIFRHEL